MILAEFFSKNMRERIKQSDYMAQQWWNGNTHGVKLSPFIKFTLLRTIEHIANDCFIWIVIILLEYLDLVSIHVWYRRWPSSTIVAN